MAGRSTDVLRQGFAEPPTSARPGVYWYFMDGNLSKEGMTKDLEAMSRAGIGAVLFLEVNVGVPRGNVDFLSEEWKSCFRHAVKECERLGITMTLGIGPGWTGSGGPWVSGEQSMQDLVGASVDVRGKGRQTLVLPKPDPMKPFFGDAPFTPELRQRWKDFYRDVAVLAFPKVKGDARIKDINEKVLYYRSPYSSDPSTKQFLGRDSVIPGLTADMVVRASDIVVLTDKLKGDTLVWEVPDGEWTIMRFGVRNNGAVTRPSPLPGVGFECDKADSLALKAHLEAFTEQLFDIVGERDCSLTGGLKYLHMDSWEMGAQNWTPKMREEFIKRRGYDPQPFYPVYTGLIVESQEKSERFLWDLRQTLQELMLEHHAKAVKVYAHKNGMEVSVEPYDMNPMQDMELAAACDVVMAEFWSPGWFNTSFGSIEASSVANIKGQRLVPAESFTAAYDGWRQHPASMKNQTDWALAAGINKMYFHTFQHQALPDSLRPGMTMGIYGVHWDRNQTWWPYVHAYHGYLGRCQYMLQSGRTVADVLYLAPEEAPYVFKAPKSALDHTLMPDRKGYSFDACPPSLLSSAYVENGDVVFPSGARYRLLVMPNFERVTVAHLEHIARLVADGATVVGLPPTTVPGLANLEAEHAHLEEIIADMWGSDKMPSVLTKRPYGKGFIIWGQPMKDGEDNLYANYGLTSAILKEMGVAEDFATDGTSIRYTHKVADDGRDYYFVSNRTDEPTVAECKFRVTGKHAELWNPMTGEIRKIKDLIDNGETTTISLPFDIEQSWFVMFDTKPSKAKPFESFTTKEELMSINGPWKVEFDTKWGGPEMTTFAELADWSKSDNDSIKYYSGTAVYTTEFTLDKKPKGNVYINLGDVANIASVKINGKDVGIVWARPWTIEVSDALKKGSNEISIEVTNLWVNRLIGDEQKADDGIQNEQWPDWMTAGKARPSDRYTFATFKHYKADSPLQPSGLLGPVRLEIKK